MAEASPNDTPAARPFRHLCPDADARDAMTDDEFWQHVADNLTGPTWEPSPDDEPLHDLPDAGECPACGERGACMYDAEGRPLTHTTEGTDD